MSNLRRDISRKKLTKLLQAADDEAFFIMVWATHAVQSGRPEKAQSFLNFPQDAASTDLSSRFAVHPWRLETMLNEVLTTPKLEIVAGRPNRCLNCGLFRTIARVTNVLSELENAEDGFAIRRVSVLKEMHRLAQRQFEWQRGFISLAQLYRSAFIYGGNLATAYFTKTYGLTMKEFSLACFALRVLFQEKPIVLRRGGMNEIGISESTLGNIYNMISIPHMKARQYAFEQRSGAGHPGYKKSMLRRYPCVAFGSNGERLHSPLPDLLTLRATSGLFYDLINGGDDVKNEISSRFELYCLEYLQKMLPSFTISPSFKYGLRSKRIDSPDILVSDENGDISIIFECKAKRMSHEARFSEDPVTEKRQAYEEIAKGIFQIWRFTSHHRQGMLDEKRLSSDIKGIVLTLDTWMSFATTMHEEVFKLAREKANNDSNITEVDQIPVIFSTIDSLEYMLNTANESSFLRAITASTKIRFRGWELCSVHQEVEPDTKLNNAYPFESRMGEVIPWWNSF
jgi:hypothetical protein